MTKTVAGGKTHLALSAPLKSPAPDAAADSAPDVNDKLAVDADVQHTDRAKSQMSASGQPKSILKKNKVATTAVKTSAICSTDGGIDADAVLDDGVINIDREDGGMDDEEVDSDGVVGVCLHCSRPLYFHSPDFFLAFRFNFLGYFRMFSRSTVFPLS